MKRLLYIAPTILFIYSGMTCFHISSTLKSTSFDSRMGSFSGGLRQSAPLYTSAFGSQGYSNQYSNQPRPRYSTGTLEANIEGDKNAAYHTPIHLHEIPAPEFTRGIYLTNQSGYSMEKLDSFIEKAQRYRVNTFVIDVQKKMIPKENIDKVKEAGIFPVARVVVFEGGLKQREASREYIDAIIQKIEDSAYQGFLEVQLDYIRYADNPELLSIPLAYKYEMIGSILKRAKEKADEMAIYLSADLFGRVTLHQNDHIGQRLEIFAEYMDTIYPMLYPSHYTNDTYRITNPYATVKEGVANSLKRCPQTRIVAYIQGFDMKVAGSGKTLPEYIEAQMRGTADAQGHGWVIWEARNNYEASYSAMENFHKKNQLSKVIVARPKVP